MHRIFTQAVCAALCTIVITAALDAQTLQVPPRSAIALSGSEIAEILAPLSRADREARIYREIASGNIPRFLRRMVKITDTATIAGTVRTVSYFVTPDYLALGSDSDHIRMPMSPILAQRVADLCSCTLPTRKMVDVIYRAAAIKIDSQAIAPSPAMITMPVFQRHDSMVSARRTPLLAAHPLGELVGGTKKDVILSPYIYTNLKKNVPRPVVIYGWHTLKGFAIQPRYNGHQDTYADYSHGIRLVQRSITVDGSGTSIEAVLRDTTLYPLLSDEGVIAPARYPLPDPALMDSSARGTPGTLPGFTEEGPWKEQVLRFNFPSDVSITINAPPVRQFDPSKHVRLIFYALPNGNTTLQTAGKKLKEGDDWHYNIQHIAAQTRFLRTIENDRNIVTVYLETSARSWGSAWISKQSDPHTRVRSIVDSVMKIFAPSELHVTLNSHSGGGNFIFTYLDSTDALPAQIERIAFLDSDYRYTDEYGAKLSNWLKASDSHSLCVLAYNDSIALLNGKPFVSATGGTWVRTKMMKERLAQDFAFTERFDPAAGIHSFRALDGRIQLLLKENPGREIFHTVQVELNGFIHSCLSGTSHEKEGYAYFGSRAYERWIEE